MRDSTRNRMKRLIEDSELTHDEIRDLLESLAAWGGNGEVIKDWVIDAGLTDADDWRDEVIRQLDEEGSRVVFDLPHIDIMGARRHSATLDSLGVKVEAVGMDTNPDYETEGYLWVKVWANDLDRLARVNA